MPIDDISAGHYIEVGKGIEDIDDDEEHKSLEIYIWKRFDNDNMRTNRTTIRY